MDGVQLAEWSSFEGYTPFIMATKFNYKYVLDIALHRNILICIKCDPDKVKQEELGIVRECGTVLFYEIEGTLN